MRLIRAGVDFEEMEVYSREINLKLTCAGIYCEREQVASREINWNTSEFEENLDFRCMLDFDTSGLV